MKTFTLFSYPERSITDNGKQFISDEFEAFAQTPQHYPQRVTPYWPQANGEVERFNANIGKVLRYAEAENKNLRKELDDFLLMYRSTPHCGTGKSPADVFFQHRIKNDVPNLPLTALSDKDTITRTDQQYQQKVKAYADNKRHAGNIATFNIGDTVLSKNFQRRNKSAPYFEPEVYTVVEVYPHSLKLKSSIKTVVRHFSHVKRFMSHEQDAKQPTTVTPTNPTIPIVQLGYHSIWDRRGRNCCN